MLGPSILLSYVADAHNQMPPVLTYKVTAHQ